MSALGRWASVDPKSGKNYKDSPYVYVVENPLIYIGPAGADTTRPRQRRLTQGEVLSATSTAISTGNSLVRGKVAYLGVSVKTLSYMSRISGGVGFGLALIDFVNDPSRENAVSESLTYLGGVAGGFAGGTACGTVTVGTATAAAPSCGHLIPAGAVGGTIAGKFSGDAVNFIIDYIEEYDLKDLSRLRPPTEDGSDGPSSSEDENEEKDKDEYNTEESNIDNIN